MSRPISHDEIRTGLPVIGILLDQTFQFVNGLILAAIHEQENGINRVIALDCGQALEVLFRLLFVALFVLETRLIVKRRTIERVDRNRNLEFMAGIA
ncbi:MAG TPA: hypothetical protein VLZ81_09685 [Blastocatellia bacterium]|nr:hypothetical protein [Blastocatellia bacterium]